MNDLPIVFCVAQLPSHSISVIHSFPLVTNSWWQHLRPKVKVTKNKQIKQSFVIIVLKAMNHGFLKYDTRFLFNFIKDSRISPLSYHRIWDCWLDLCMHWTDRILFFPKGGMSQMCKVKKIEFSGSGYLNSKIWVVRKKMIYLYVQAYCF